jgi:hypothetical protein
MDIGFQESHPDFPQARLNIFLGQLAMAFEFFKYCIKPVT